MPQRRYEKHLRKDEAVTGLLVLFIVIAYLASVGCVTISGPEPVWEPDVHKYANIGGEPGFYNFQGDLVRCDDPKIHSMVLMPTGDLVSGVKKFDRCETWR